jgi:excisionase family DNA binding protein
MKAHDDQLDIRQAAQRWRVSYKTVRKLISSRQLSILRLGRAIRIPMSEILRWEKAQLERSPGGSNART